MTRLTAYGDKAKELMSYGAFGTFRVDGMEFTIIHRSIEGRDTVDIDIKEVDPSKHDRQPK